MIGVYLTSGKNADLIMKLDTIANDFELIEDIENFTPTNFIKLPE